MACLRVAPLVMVAALLALAGSAASNKYNVYWCNSPVCNANCQKIKVQSENTCTAPGMDNVPPALIVVPRNQTFITLQSYKNINCDSNSLFDTETFALSDNGVFMCVGTGSWLGPGVIYSSYVQSGFARALAASPLTLALASLLALLAMALMT